MVRVTELTNLAVDLVDVHKTYRKTVQALRGVNVQVRRGEIFGLLGPNGAGKSTLVKIMMTVVRPDKLVGTILGRPLGNRKKLALIGYLPENHRFPPYLTGEELLDYYGALAKVPKAMRRRRAAELLEWVAMSKWAKTCVGEYSKGMMQRLGLVQALLNDPQLLVLDEPTDGLDPAGRRAVRELLLRLRSEGKTIFLNSHLLSELEMVCDRVSILVNGLVARQGTLRELTEHTVEYRITTTGDLAAVKEAVERCGARIDNTVIILNGHNVAKVNELIDLLRGKGVLIESVVPHRFSLEEVFMETLGTAR
ncbi:MAG: ABC transporter ATP-binding protein [Phycisphaerae bacterium]|nr:ABC transporter ATP-binding protein [Phycisphaerae bacterium]